MFALGRGHACMVGPDRKQKVNLTVYATLHGLNLNCGAGLRKAGEARWQEV
jgi:hypothetical protein